MRFDNVVQTHFCKSKIILQINRYINAKKNENNKYTMTHYEEDNNYDIIDCIWCTFPSREECWAYILSLSNYCRESSKETIRQGICNIIRWRRTRLYIK